MAERHKLINYLIPVREMFRLSCRLLRPLHRAAVLGALTIAMLMGAATAPVAAHSTQTATVLTCRAAHSTQTATAPAASNALTCRATQTATAPAASNALTCRATHLTWVDGMASTPNRTPNPVRTLTHLSKGTNRDSGNAQEAQCQPPANRRTDA